MTVNDSRLVESFDSLIRACHNGERGFRRCAGQAQAMALQWLLTQRAQHYRKAAAELESLRGDVVGTAPAHTPCEVDPQPGWAAPSRVLATWSDLALLAECERGEDITLLHYRRVLDEDLPIMLRVIAQRHCDATRSQRAQLRSLLLAMRQDQASGASGPVHGDARAA